MVQLVVRNLPDELVKALKQRAAKHSRSAEQEHREILEAALCRPKRRTLAAVFASMPNVGRDEDFVRHQIERSAAAEDCPIPSLHFIHSVTPANLVGMLRYGSQTSNPSDL